MRILLGLAVSLALGASALPDALAQDAKAPPPVQRLIPGTVGQGPLKLTASAAVTYNEYFSHACPQVLTVDAFGWATHAVLGDPAACPTDKTTVSADVMKGALNACVAYSRNPPCSVVAVRKKVVWNGAIGFVPGRLIPQGDRQMSIILRKIVPEGAESPTFETSVGLVTMAPGGHAGEIEFQRHGELGLCQGSLTAPDGEAAAVVLNCTKSRPIAGTIDLKTESRSGAGNAADGGDRRYAVTVLPPADFMVTGATIYAPPPKDQPGNAAKPAKAASMKKQDGKKQDGAS